MIRRALQRNWNIYRPYSSGVSEEQTRNPYLSFLNANKGAITVLLGLTGGVITGLNWLIGMKVDKLEVKYDLKFDNLEMEVRNIREEMRDFRKDMRNDHKDMRNDHKELMNKLEPFFRKVEVHDALIRRGQQS
ncbi:hypothetical protein MIR68_012493 [Amoeboaphelidium protococcarum]|nr:hypothetical protein MIR68_012493 [Amoeboaphelidium protococcarum]